MISKQYKVSCVIQYQCNVSLNFSQIAINTNSTLLGSSSSATITPMETTSDIILESTVTADTTSGRHGYYKTSYKMYVCQNIHLDI